MYMPEIPDLNPEDMAYLTELDTRADGLFSLAESADLRQCQHVYMNAINQRTHAITTYMQDKGNPMLAKYLKAQETQLYAHFCEYIHLLLHSPGENGPHIAEEIAGALSLADASQVQVNMQEEKLYQFDDTKKLQGFIFSLAMTTSGTGEMEVELERFYKKYIHDIVINFVDHNTQ